jgi:surface carbohydrate biosynthesis protein
MNSKVNILLPIETINRDLDFRLFVACAYLKPHHRFFVGFHGIIYPLATRMRKGLFVGKHFVLLEPTRETYTRYHVLKERGFLCVHLDEEGAVYPGDVENWRHRLRWQFNPCALSAEDYMCTWGDFQREFYLSLGPECAANIRTTGHPRFDLYKRAYRKYFAEDVEALRARYGDFLLVNGNFTIANNGLGISDTFSKRSGYNPAGLDVAPGATVTRRDYFDWWAHTSHVLINFIRLINRLSLEFPSHQIIIRPHPSEDWNYYKIVFNGIENVHVEHRGPVAPWLLACKVLIHDGCTTAIEAFLGDTPIINYRTVDDVKQDTFLPNIFGVKCRTEEEVVLSVRRLLSEPQNGPPPADFNDTAYRLLANFKHDSFARFMEVMAEAEDKLGGSSESYSDLHISLHEHIREAVDMAKAVVRPLFPAKHRQYKFFAQNMFYGFSEPDIRRRLVTIQEILGKPITYRFYSDGLLSIEAGH